MPHFLKQIWNSRDIPSAILLLAILAAGLWMAALPLSTQVQQTFLRRFHLASSSYPVWAIQQTVPSMYNFENKYWFSHRPMSQDVIDQLASEETRIVNTKGISTVRRNTGSETEIVSNMVNHFPTRVATFADERIHLKDNPKGFYYFRTRYRGEEIKTTFKLEPGSLTEFKLRRVGTSFE